MGDVDKEPEEGWISLQDLLFFVARFEGHNTGVGHDNEKTNGKSSYFVKAHVLPSATDE